MKESQLHQSELQLLEAQLTEMLPRLPLEQQTELLYRCAFAAGRHEGAQRASRWRTISAVCLLLTVGMAVPMFRPGVSIPEVEVESMAISPTSNSNTVAEISSTEPPLVKAPLVASALDAWQRDDHTAESFEQQFDKFGRLDAGTRAYSVSGLALTLRKGL